MTWPETRNMWRAELLFAFAITPNRYFARFRRLISFGRQREKKCCNRHLTRGRSALSTKSDTHTTKMRVVLCARRRYDMVFVNRFVVVVWCYTTFAHFAQCMDHIVITESIQYNNKKESNGRIMESVASGGKLATATTTTTMKRPNTSHVLWINKLLKCHSCQRKTKDTKKLTKIYGGEARTEKKRSFLSL